ncbi:MAG TPA: trigger factor [Pyrinomonadaceae bacterium]|nr:trigger factor [Pyrinomonadaceae bacterium]
MKSELVEVSPTRKELKIEVEADAVRDVYANVSRKYSKGASVPGFRKGFAPLDVVKIRYKDEIKNEVLREVLPPKVAEAIQSHGLTPLVEPELHVENIESLVVNGSQPISFHVHIEVMPDLGEPDYKGIEVERSVRPVPDSEIEELIQGRLKEQAALIPVEDRAAEVGDVVIADLVGVFDDDPDGEPITADGLEIELGGESIEQAFTDNLIGVSPEDEKEFSVTYPAEFSSSALAGRTVRYKAAVRSVGRSELPELNDEWAKSLDEEYNSVGELREKLRNDLEIFAGADADARIRNDLVGKLLDKNQFEVPQSLIDNQARNLLNNFAQDLQQRGVDPNRLQSDFVQMAFEQMRSQAERDIRGALLLEKIAEIENVEVSQEEVEEEIGRMASHYGTTVEEIRKALDRQDGDRPIRNSLRTRQSIEALVARSVVVESEWKEPEAEGGSEPPKPPKRKAAAAKGMKKEKEAAKSEKAD